MDRDVDLSRLDEEIDRGRKKVKGLEDLKVYEDVFDRFTLLTLYWMANKGYIEVLCGAVKTGKESNVFLATDRDDRRYAVKIHRILTADFNSMLKYIEGDRRFRKIKRSRRNIILTWVEKEFQNLLTAYDAGVKVPRPVVSRNNIVLMEFVGVDDSPAPTLKKTGDRSEKVYEAVAENLKILFDAGLVHGDMSEYNILLRRGEPFIIDLSQAVPTDHPMARELLNRDVKNISRYFDKKFDKVYGEIVN